MARRDETGELVTVSELLEQSQTKPLLIRGELDELLEAHPVRESPPPDPPRRRVRPVWLAVGAAALLGLALVLLLPSGDEGGTAVTPPKTPYVPPPTSSEAVATFSATAAPTTATAGIRQEPVETTTVRASRKPTASPPATTENPEEYWRDFLSSVISSYENGPGHRGPQR